MLMYRGLLTSLRITSKTSKIPNTKHRKSNKILFHHTIIPSFPFQTPASKSLLSLVLSSPKSQFQKHLPYLNLATCKIPNFKTSKPHHSSLPLSVSQSPCLSVSPSPILSISHYSLLIAQHSPLTTHHFPFKTHFFAALIFVVSLIQHPTLNLSPTLRVR